MIYACHVIARFNPAFIAVILNKLFDDLTIFSPHNSPQSMLLDPSQTTMQSKNQMTAVLHS